MPRFTGSVLRYARDSDGRVLSVDLDSGVRIVNVYDPAQYGQQKDFFNSLDSCRVGPSCVILVGDFDCVLEQADHVSLRGTPKFRDRNGDLELQELVNELGLVDAWRSLRALQSGITWTGRRSRSRIDRFHVSPSPVPSMHSSWLCSSALSDHSLLALRFADSSLVPWGKRPWRLNPRLPKDKDATKDVARFLIGSLLGDQNLGGSEWDTVKAGVAERFRDWGKRRAREERAGLKAVSDAVLLLLKPLSDGPGVTAALPCAKKIESCSSDAGTACGPQHAQSSHKWRLGAAEMSFADT
ncbi:hypothetical protein HPB51_019053 [Rhipicephalus microplus]|uniref:Uncharacterized protein n=1 Tax=Rhipicephalus microplus TaxID=6941 RepID=A0A9J6D6C8_RHIMP|nr:hypothetical protein HPB51_019053 [Rhipicephalus microplus]